MTTWWCKNRNKILTYYLIYQYGKKTTINYVWNYPR